ncbi:MAG: hypothetical protein IPH33_19520 [Bacteroidetes bacterium]|nr:hypothetical protein [Bacteroidota bacterium]
MPPLLNFANLVRNSEEKLELLEKYKNATTKEKLETIVVDKTFPPEYYPTDWIKFPKEIEKTSDRFNKETLRQTLHKNKRRMKRYTNLKKLDDGIG